MQSEHKLLADSAIIPPKADLNIEILNANSQSELLIGSRTNNGKLLIYQLKLEKSEFTLIDSVDISGLKNPGVLKIGAAFIPIAFNRSKIKIGNQYIYPPATFRFSKIHSAHTFDGRLLYLRLVSSDTSPTTKGFYEKPLYLIVDSKDFNKQSQAILFPSEPYHYKRFYYNFDVFTTIDNNTFYCAFGLSEEMVAIREQDSSFTISSSEENLSLKLQVFDSSKVEDFRYIKKYLDKQSKLISLLAADGRVYRVFKKSETNQSIFHLWRYEIKGKELFLYSDIEITQLDFHPFLFKYINKSHLIVGRQGNDKRYFHYYHLKL